MVNVAMGQDQKINIIRRQSQDRQLPGRSLSGREIDQPPKPRQIVTGVRGRVIGGIGRVKTGIDQNMCAFVGCQQKARNANCAFAGAHVKGAKIKHIKPGDMVVCQGQGMAFGQGVAIRLAGVRCDVRRCTEISSMAGVQSHTPWPKANSKPRRRQTDAAHQKLPEPGLSLPQPR